MENIWSKLNTGRNVHTRNQGRCVEARDRPAEQRVEICLKKKKNLTQPDKFQRNVKIAIDDDYYFISYIHFTIGLVHVL